MQAILNGPGQALGRAVLAGAILMAALACTPQEVPPWADPEMDELLDYFGEIGEAYAVLDICMPMLEADEDAKYQLVSAIKADRYAKLLQFDTAYELKRLFGYFRKRGGTPEQNLALRLRYEEAWQQAGHDITSVEVCIITIKDYANTIINMRVQ